MPVPSPYRNAWPENAAKLPADLRAVLDDIEARLDQATTGGGKTFGLNFDGVTENTTLATSIATEIAAGRDHMVISPPTGTANPYAYFDRVVGIQNFSRPFTLELRGCGLIYGPNAELRSAGQELELPETGKARLWANVDASGGSVVAFDIDVSANPSIVSLLTAGRPIRIRGENDAGGDVLDGYMHETTVVSCVLVSGTRYTLTISTPLPTTVPSGLWKKTWDGSDWNISVGGPAQDDTLISVLTEMVLDQEVENTSEIPVPSGFDAVAAFPVGSYVLAQSDATCSDLVAGSGSNEPVTQQMAKVIGHDEVNDLVLLDRIIRGVLYLTVNATNMRPRLTRMQSPIEPTILFDPAFPAKVVGTIPAPPASRRHIVQHRYAVRPRTFDVRLYGDDNASDVHGALVRESLCLDGYGARLVRYSAKHKATGGSGNGVWLKGSSGSLYENCLMVGCRHGMTSGGGESIVWRNNIVSDSWESAIDLGHGEGGHSNSAIGNHVFAGRPIDGRPVAKGIEVSNNSALFGDDDAVIQGNHFYGFDSAEASCIRLRSGSRGAKLLDNVIHGTAAIGINATVDRRAPQQGISDLYVQGLISGCTVGVLLDGRPPAWESEAEISGTASRPTYLEDSSRTRLYKTTGSGNLGTVNPTHTTGTATNGDIDLEYVGPVADQTIPIQGVKILADLSQAGTAVTQHRAADVVITSLARLGESASEAVYDLAGGSTTIETAAGTIRLTGTLAASAVINIAAGWAGERKRIVVEGTLGASDLEVGPIATAVADTTYTIAYISGNWVIEEASIRSQAPGPFARVDALDTTDIVFVPGETPVFEAGDTNADLALRRLATAVSEAGVSAPPPSEVVTDAATFVLDSTMSADQNVVVTTDTAGRTIRIKKTETERRFFIVMPKHTGTFDIEDSVGTINGQSSYAPTFLANRIYTIQVVENAASAPDVVISGIPLPAVEVNSTRSYSSADHERDFLLGAGAGDQTMPTAAATPAGYYWNIRNETGGAIDIVGADATHELEAGGIITVSKWGASLVAFGSGGVTVLDAA